MTKDLAALIGESQEYLTTKNFLEAVEQNFARLPR